MRWRQGLGRGPVVPSRKKAVEAASQAEENHREEPTEGKARPPSRG